MILNSYILEDRREKEKTATVNKISKKGTTTLLHRFRILAHLDFELDSEARSARRNKVLTLRKEVKEPGDSLPSSFQRGKKKNKHRKDTSGNLTLFQLSKTCLGN